VVGATVVTMGLISLPAMLRAGYDPKLASGIICASGTLGQIIPPSTILILLADILQGAYAQAQMRKGNFAPESISVVDLFAGALIPGVVLAGLYVLWVVVQAVRNPSSCPPLVITDKRFDNLGQRMVKALIPPLGLIVVVLGSILTGMATSTESAALGAVGALILAASRRLLTRDVLLSAMRSTMTLSSMCFMIVIGASLFALVFRGLQGEALVETFLHALPGGPLGAMAFVMILIFLLGFILDFVEIMFMVLPIVAPVLLMMDISPVWLGVMVAINLQTSFLTPPVGFALFYFRSIAPPSLKTTEIYLGIIPFVALQLLGLTLVWAFPGLATWLPQALFGGP
jgi:tripartite ATP-independent transporter DctM subunit